MNEPAERITLGITLEDPQIVVDDPGIEPEAQSSGSEEV